MRDVDRIAEKIQFALDRRQVVSIVLGSTVLLGVVFYLGVTVGKELAAEQPPAVVDSLEELDREAERIAQRLTFPDALTDEPAPPPPSPVAAAEARGDDAPAKPPPAPAPEKQDPPPAEPEKAPSAREPEAVAAAAPKQEEKPAPDPAPAPAKAPAIAAPPAGEGGFTVQVGAMPTRAEADALVSRLRASGLSPYVVEADVPGKGFFYRVRIGRFATREDAQRYLADLKRETSLSGFVALIE